MFIVGDHVRINPDWAESEGWPRDLVGEVCDVREVKLAREYNVGWDHESTKYNGWGYYSIKHLLPPADPVEDDEDDNDYVPPLRGSGQVLGDKIQEMNEGYSLFHGTPGPYGGRRSF